MPRLTGAANPRINTAAEYTARTAKLVFGLLLFALGQYLVIRANIGLSPWVAFSMGLSYLTGMTYGVATVTISFSILVADYFLKEKIGFGTILNSLLIGPFVDMIHSFGVIPEMSGFFSGVIVLLLGQFAICLGSYFYIGAAMGCGARDSLMVALYRRMPRIPVGAIRVLIEGSALVAGWLLGAKVGIGTVISVFGIGFMLQLTFDLLRFDVKSIVHEDIADTIRIIFH